MKTVKSTLSYERQKSSLFFVAPLIVTLLIIAGFPLLTTLYYAFTDAHLSDLSQAKFIGLGNYKKILSDSNWWSSVYNTFLFTLVSVLLETILGIIIALALNKHFRGRGLVRAIVFIPWAIPTIVSARLWGWMYHDVYGILNEIVKFVGLTDHPLAWTASPNLVMISVIIVDVWKTTPIMTMMILAGLQLIPQECYEAAKIDGIHPVRVFFRVTLPLLKSTLLVAMILRTLDALRVFDLIYVLTPNNSRTISMSVYAHQNLFTFQETGIGSAAASLLFLIVLSITFIYLFVGKKMAAYESH